MKKILVSLMALTILSSTAVYASDTPVSDWINSKTSKITQTEQSASAKAAEKKKKQQEKIAKQKEKQAEQQKKAAERKQKVQTKKNQLKDLFTVD